MRRPKRETWSTTLTSPGEADAPAAGMFDDVSRGGAAPPLQAAGSKQTPRQCRDIKFLPDTGGCRFPQLTSCRQTWKMSLGKTSRNTSARLLFQIPSSPTPAGLTPSSCPSTTWAATWSLRPPRAASCPDPTGIERCTSWSSRLQTPAGELAEAGKARRHWFILEGEMLQPISVQVCFGWRQTWRE